MFVDLARRMGHLVGMTYPRHPVRVLGVDPGMTRCGVGVVDGAPGRILTLTHVEVIRTPSDVEVGERLLALDSALRAAIERFAPDVVAVERVFAQHNVRTVM